MRLEWVSAFLHLPRLPFRRGWPPLRLAGLVFLIIGLFPASGLASEAFQSEVEEIVALSVTEPWTVSQQRIEALRPHFDELSESQRHELNLVEARNRILAGDRQAAHVMLETLLAQAPELPLRLRAYVLISNAAVFRDDFEPAFRYLIQGLELLELVDQPEARADVLGRASLLFGRVDEHDRAMEYARRAVHEARRSGNPRELCAELFQYANAQYMHPLIEPALVAESTRAARQACDEAGDPVFRAVVENLEGMNRLAMGQVDEAVEWHERALGMMREAGYTIGIAEARLALGEARFRQGDGDGAMAVLEGLADELAAEERWQEEVQARELVSRIHEQRGELAPALDEATRAREASIRQYEGESSLQAAFLQVDFENRLRAFDLRILEEKGKQERLERDALVVAVFLFLAIGGLAWSRYRIRTGSHRIIERRNRELATLGEIVHRINTCQQAEEVHATLLRESLSVVADACWGELLVRDWYRHRFLRVSLQGDYPSDLSSPPASDRALIEQYLSPARSLAEGVHLLEGRSGAEGEHFLVLSLETGPDIEGLLVLALSRYRPRPVEDIDGLRRLRTHAIAALQRARDLEELASESQRVRAGLEELQHTNTRLRQAIHEARLADEAKTGFIARVSHELRTPLHAVSGYSQKLRQRATAEAFSEQAVKSLDRIHAASEHLYSLVDELTDTNRLEAGRDSLRLERVDLHELFATVVSMIQPQVAHSGNRLEVDIDEGVTSLVTDPVKLRQILLNLLSNAARFTDQGLIRLQARRDARPGEDATADLLISVSDTGIGIAVENQAHIFDAFSQSNEDISRQSGGTGLGLAVSRNLCELLGGEMAVSSQPGQGSVFTLRLPFDPSLTDRQRAGLAEPRPATGEEVSLAGRTAFLVEDNRINRLLMQEYLEQEGLKVLSEETAEAAIEAIARHRPDVILMDMNLPGMPGDEATRVLGFRDETRDIPVIAVSADAGHHMQARAREAGCLHYETKPVNFTRLLAVIRQAVSS